MIAETRGGQPDSLCADTQKRKFEIKDGGERRTFSSGAVRDTSEAKSRPDLISPFALMRVGEWFAKGADKYGERNWEKGFPDSVLYASLFRHVLKYAMGDRQEDHLSAIVFNAQALIHQEEAGPLELHDMPRKDPCWLIAMGHADRDAERVIRGPQAGDVLAKR